MPVSIPIRASVSIQKFDIALDNIVYQMVAKWNSRSEFWTLDIFDENGGDVVLGIALKLGARLLKQFGLDMGEMIIVDDTNSGTEASLSSFGISTTLVYFTPAELEAIAA